MIWTRLAVYPLADDGLGGMPSRQCVVRWLVAADESFTTVVRRGESVTGPGRGHAVHVVLRGLPPGREYYHRFRTGAWVSRVGRALAAPPAGSLPASLSMAFASCSQSSKATSRRTAG